MNEEKIKELAECLEIGPDGITVSEYDENTFLINSRMEKDGYPPQRYINIISKFKRLLTEEETEQIRNFILSKHDKEQRDEIYNTVKDNINTHKKDTDEYKEIKKQALYVENVLYHILSGEDADHVTKYKKAFLGETIVDDRELRQVNNGEYLVLTDAEADQRTKDHIKETVWAFKPWFIINHSDLPDEAEEMVKGFCEEKCESANETVLALIKDFDKFVEDAVHADGRGHFLSNYDGDERETENFYIYRQH